MARPPRATIKSNSLQYDSSRRERVGGRYANFIGPKLAEIMRQMQENASDDPHDITDELEQLRALHISAMGRYNLAMQCAAMFPDTVEGNQNRMAVMQTAEDMMKESLHGVISAIEKSARITALVADKLHPTAIASIVKQISGFVFECFDGTDDAAKQRIDKFERMMDEKLQLPTVAQLGTSITPDQSVTAMDQSVPYCPPGVSPAMEALRQAEEANSEKNP